MRKTAMLALLPALAAAPLNAQGFEGAVSVKTDTTDPNSLRNEVLHVTPGRMAITGLTGPASQIGAGAEMRILVDWTAAKITVLLPLAGQMAQMAQMNPQMKGIKIVTDIPAATATKASTLKALGTSQTIAGMKCDDYVETGVKEPRQLCLTKALGRFTMPSTGRGGRGGGGPSWANAIGDNGFPLKVWIPNGTVDFEATAVRPGSVPGSIFAIPDGYMDMGSLGRMGRGGGF